MACARSCLSLFLTRRGGDSLDFLMYRHLPGRDRLGIVILGRETFHRADLDTEVADAAPEPVDLPRPVLLGDSDGISRTAPAALAAEDAPVNGVFYPPPGDGRKNPLPLRIHEGGRPRDQIPGYRFRHRENLHVPVLYGESQSK